MRMTEKKPSHRLLRSAPLVALAVGVVATACDVAGRAGRTADSDLATAPHSPESTPAGGTVTDLGGGRMMVATSARARDPSRASLGLGSMSWEEGKGPAFRSGKVQPPTGFPTVDKLRTDGRLWQGGLRDGDVILAVNGKDARQAMLFNDAHPGARYDIQVRRGGEQREFQVVLE